MHKKRLKICTGYRVSEAKIYLYQSTKIAKARPHSVEWQTDSSVQKQWFITYQKGKIPTNNKIGLRFGGVVNLSLEFFTIKHFA